MSEAVKKNNSGGNRKGKSEESKNNASSSKPKRCGSKRKYLRPDEAGSKYMVFSDRRNNNNNNNNQNPPPPPPPPPLPPPPSSSSGTGAKVVPVVLKPANDLPHLRKGKSIFGNYSRDRDPFLPVNWPSPAIGIPPPSPSLRNKGFGREEGRETPTTGGEYYGRNFKEAAAVVNEKMSQYLLLPQQNVREKDS